VRKARTMAVAAATVIGLVGPASAAEVASAASPTGVNIPIVCEPGFRHVEFVSKSATRTITTPGSLRCLSGAV